MSDDHEPRKPRRKADIVNNVANLSLNVSQVIALGLFIWGCAVKYEKFMSQQSDMIVMLGDTKADIGRLAERVERIEKH